MKKEHRTNRRYSAEFKIRAILDMRNNHLGYNETVYKYWDVKNSAEANNYTGRLRLWERIYLEDKFALIKCVNEFVRDYNNGFYK